MLKIRVQGTTYDIKWFVRLLSKDERFTISEPSEIFDNKGSVKYKRMYVELYRDAEECERKRNQGKVEKNRYFGTGKVLTNPVEGRVRKNTAERRFIGNEQRV